MENLSYYVNKKIVYVSVERTTNKNMYLKIKGDDIIVTAPRKIVLSDIDAFVKKHIEKFVKYVENKKAAQLYSIENNFIWLYGKKFNLKILTGFKKNILVLKGDNAYVETADGNESNIETAIKEYLRKTLLKYIEKVSVKFEKKMNVPEHLVKVIYKTRTWGTNMIEKRSISYSSRLAHYNTNIIDYVIVHELAHFYEPNHQKNFWKIVETQLPNYKELQKQLKEDQTLSEE